jgi:hypothetical protein
MKEENMQNFLKNGKKFTRDIMDHFLKEVIKDAQNDFKKNKEVAPTLYRAVIVDERKSVLGAGLNITKTPKEVFSSNDLKYKFFKAGGKATAEQFGKKFIGVIMVNEVWMATAEKGKKDLGGKKPSEMPNKKEAVMISALTITTECKNLMFEIDRKNNTIDKPLKVRGEEVKFDWVEHKKFKENKVGVQNNLLDTFLAEYIKTLFKSDKDLSEIIDKIEKTTQGEKEEKHKVDPRFEEIYKSIMNN